MAPCHYRMPHKVLLTEQPSEQREKQFLSFSFDNIVEVEEQETEEGRGLSKTFIMKGYWIWSKAFSASSEIIMCFFSFSLFIWWITLTDLYMLNHPCISGMKAP